MTEDAGGEVCHTCASPRPRPLRREFAELGGVLAAAGSVHAFAAAVGHFRHGGLVLLGLGVAVLAGAVVYRSWTHRRQHRQRELTHRSPQADRLGPQPTPTRPHQSARRR